jgi:hypothetical protein
VATSSFGFLAFTVHHSSTSVWFFPCFGDGQRLYTCVLTGPLVSHASISVACVLGSVACVYFCHMRLLHIELSELERTRSFPYSSSLYAPKGTEDASLGHKTHKLDSTVDSTVLTHCLTTFCESLVPGSANIYLCWTSNG